MSVVLALDQGTTSSRAIVFNRQGQVLGVAQREIKQFYPQPAWVEHDPIELWHSQLSVAREALKNARVSASDVVALGITNQRETTIIWDKKTGEPIAPAIVWQDRRTAELCDTLRIYQEDIQAVTGLVLDAYFSATKIAWLLTHIPGARARAERGELAFGTVDSWLIWNLTGGRLHATDVSNASRTLLFDIHKKRWSSELLALFDIPESLLPNVFPSSALWGETDAQCLGSKIMIAGVAGDQQAATFGQACLRPGMAKNTYGTGCFMLMNVGTQAAVSKHRLLSTVGWDLTSGVGDFSSSAYMLEGSIFIAGAAVQWLRDNLGIVQRADEIESLASQVSHTEGVYFVPALTGLGAPYWNPYVRGSLVGLSRATTKAHIARATLEAIAFQSAELLSVMQKDCDCSLQELRVDGGAAKNNLLMQFQADILGVPVVRPKITETTALGAAYLAGLAVGYWDSLDQVNENWQVDRVFQPSMSEDHRCQRLTRWQRAVAHAQAWDGC